MSSKIPVIRQIGWLSIIPQLVFLSLIIFIYYLFSVDDFLLFGSITYLLISFTLRNLIARDHCKGIICVRRKKYNEAIISFQKSFEFFNKNKLIDKFRYILLLSSSRISYREMALCNIAFIYSQIGDGGKSKYYYNIALNEFPDSMIAKSALNLINLTKDSGEII
jgi:tetratricopeptide (TPR) repeat protein